MKKFLFAFLFLFFLFPAIAGAEGKIEFGEALDSQLRLLNAGKAFPGPAVSWLAYADKPFGKPSIVVSVYKQEDGAQTLVARRNEEVNPLWNVYGARNMPLPTPGVYTLALTTVEGEPIASGVVAITPARDNTPPKPMEKTGGALRDLFHKYAPKK